MGKDAVMPATFVLQATNEGKARVELWSAQGQRLMSSELYESKQAARNAIGAIRRAAADAEIVDADRARGAKKSTKAATKSASKKSTKKAAKKSAGKKSTGSSTRKST